MAPVISRAKVWASPRSEHPLARYDSDVTTPNGGGLGVIGRRGGADLPVVEDRNRARAGRGFPASGLLQEGIGLPYVPPEATQPQLCLLRGDFCRATGGGWADVGFVPRSCDAETRIAGVLSFWLRRYAYVFVERVSAERA